MSHVPETASIAAIQPWGFRTLPPRSAMLPDEVNVIGSFGPRSQDADGASGSWS